MTLGFLTCRRVAMGTDEKGRLTGPVPLGPGDNPSITARGDNLVTSLPDRQKFIDNPETLVGKV